MNIGEESEPIEVPIPLAPGQQPIHEPAPQVVPAEPFKEPAHAMAGAGAMFRSDNVRCAKCGELMKWCRCGR
jgi:hypothetical protein